MDDVSGDLPITDEVDGQLEGEEARQAALERRITDVVDRLRADGRTVVMFEPIPVVSQEDDTLTCLSQAKALEECRFVTSTRPGGEERIMRSLAEGDDGVVSVDLDPLVCPYLPICDPVVDGQIVKVDDDHITNTFGRTLLDPVDEYLTAQGVFGTG